ncbi:RGM domain family member B-like isoform X2 [Pocillopora damicornis]|uniref:RGM domain family member B-like isoform X2 n=1 Tax=Pocillopora damicornis TaxID=46731 RepID=UPI000F54E77E|nr:RGM domain family member B-like isoform X2 [Pocillopora damicornis]
MSFRLKRRKTDLCRVLLTTCLFPLLLLVVTAETQKCTQIISDRCTMPYIRTRKAVGENNQEICTALAVYLRCIEDVKKTVKSCRSDLQFLTKSPTKPTTKRPGCLNFTSEDLKPSKEQIRLNPHHFRLCALFGDPHLKTFTEERQTCVVQGAWPLIDNNYFSVQVTNVPLVAGSSATATNTITVLIKANGKGCVDQKIYRAEASSLPAEFHDGTQRTGPADCPAEIFQRKKGRRFHIEIKICYISTTIIIRQVGDFLTFHVKIPEQLLSSVPSTGLCVTGCPSRQRIDYRELLSFTDNQLAKMRPRRSKMSRAEAYANCTETKITGFYLDSCLFDLLTTGNVNFTAAAWHALDDSFLLDEIGTLRDLQSYNTTEPRTDKPTWPVKIPVSSSQTLSHSFAILTVLLFSLFILAR